MPTPASGSEVVEIVSVGAGLTAMERAWVAVPAALSATWMVKLAVPAAEGVPEMTPVEELMVKLAGNEPADIDHV